MTDERLHKVIARAGVTSRRKAEDLIAAGRVAVNGRVVSELGVKVDPEHDRIQVDGRPLGGAAPEYWLLHKPVGVITTVEDPWGRPTARELVPTRARVFPVGRLDVDSSGLLLFTNDGALAHRLTHPRHQHEKEYRVLVDGRPSADALRRLRRGVTLDDGVTAPAEVRVLEETPDGTWLAVVLREGRKRQIRRMLDAVGYPVLALARVRMGPIGLGGLSAGQARRLTEDEVAVLDALATVLA
jgi:23S rRNA pseudouridine2605 synthase